ncbi:MAG: TIGR03790 family protein [Opitutaceae bacterium]|nr:TIGR03790 family protein [Opitutaceae bacterium]
MLHGGRWLAATGLVLGLLAAPGRAAAGDDGDPAKRIIVLANANDADSMRLARYYAEKRGVPAGNIIALPMPADETIGWPEFIAAIYQPLQDQLVARGWIDAFATTLTDSLGRKRYGISGHRISYLVVCRGVPLRVGHAPGFYVDEPRLASRAEFRTNQGAVDSELTLLAHGTYNINGWVPNPLFRAERTWPFESEPVVKVTRLDGPSFDDACRLVDQALAAERTGLIGRFYVELRGPHPAGEQWLESAARGLADLGFDGGVRRESGTMPSSARFDAPALYFGWYADDLNGPMALDGFRFPPGAIALHIHSFSAQTLRSSTSGWCGPLVARGVTATFGNVFEPYLELTIEPHLLLRALAAGRTLGDAAYYAQPALSWQSVVIGDPMYRPFAISLDEQLARLASLSPALAPYVVLRKVRLLELGKKPEEARRLLEEAWRQSPGLVLSLGLAQQLVAGGDKTGAVKTLAAVSPPETFGLGDVPLAQQAARLLLECGAAPKAVSLYQAILRNAALGRDWRAIVLREALAAAQAANDGSQAASWAGELARMSTDLLPTGKL